MERALPISDALSNNPIAPLASIVPAKTELSPKLTAPLICQYTLLHTAESISVIVDNEVVEKAPFILKINKELGLPCPSKTKFPFNDEISPRQ